MINEDGILRMVTLFVYLHIYRIQRYFEVVF